ncbi:cysteine synthase A [Paenibacillus chitinolyticus]|uniref:Cysteine synthase n=1 Tax=Paenibacillus chitinolyticus TaxID=79263 RepID=A0A410WU44_9BACL|nr:cysteine synthase A [Paenibacillus chitinolyticus]MCY9591926.1 cysteine synthase A [Paenibacillus chitinolyticus]MCY9594983.1 cysteine synthase A [Paenibacillus chitinolyticus]QAV17854.1 cysteine synthase A [Paenibacillus chitinolyticus]
MSARDGEEVEDAGHSPAMAGSVLELIGDTPVVRIRRLSGTNDAELYVKLESFNPGGSVKDRAARHMIEQAERDGRLLPGGTIIEVTSGNTGIGMALVAAVKGYRLIVIMSDNMSAERTGILQAYGAEVVLYPAEEKIEGGLRRARELERRIPGSFVPVQFENAGNADVHRFTTASEIWEQMQGKLDAFVCTSGTGGTITGTGESLKSRLPDLRIYVVESRCSPLLSGGEPGTHGIPGISPSFIPPVLNTQLYDEVLQIGDEDAYETARELARREGLLLGPSSGAAVWAGIRIAERLGRGKKVLCIAPDTGERYLSTGLYDA